MSRIPGNTKRLFTPIATGAGKTFYVSGGVNPENRFWIIVGPHLTDRIEVHPSERDFAKLAGRLWPAANVKKGGKDGARAHSKAR